MIYKTDEDVKSLIEKFENCAVSEKEWTHAAHLTAALWYLIENDLEKAIEKMRRSILKLNESHNVPNTPTRGYHETLTIFWMQIVSDFLEKAVDKSSLCALANLLIKTYDSSFPLKFHTRELLFSPAARTKYIEPNLLSLRRD